MKIEIKSITGSIFFEGDFSSMSEALKKAVSAGANLTRANLTGAYLAGVNLAGVNLTRANFAGAYLTGAYLDGANLAGAYLDRANLTGANLALANLDGAYLAGANLTGAYLDGANFAGANLAGANLAGAYLAEANLAGAYLDAEERIKLIGERPVLLIGPIGSRAAYLTAYSTDSGVYLRTGCFFGTLTEFQLKVKDTHGDNKHSEEYAVAVHLIEKNVELWTTAP